ncbi:MAG: endopeptidase [Nocardioidaceae bacterium]|nr:endopeptidase [Nocardioidaceae bacterium]
MTGRSRDHRAGARAAPPATALDRRLAWIIVAASFAVLVVLAVLLVPWSWWPAGGLRPASVGSAFTPAQVARAESYSHAVLPLSLAATSVSLALALLLGMTRLGSGLAHALSRGLGGAVGRRLPWWLLVPTVTFVLILLGRLVTLPFGLAIRRHDLAAGLTTQSLAGWFEDWALSGLVTWLFASLVVLLVVAVARRSPRHWYVGAAVGALVGTFVLSTLYPLVVEPLFNRFQPMPDSPLKQSLLRLAAAEGVHVDDVLVADASRRTTTLNAYVSGIGGTRRIVVYDNLLNDLPPDQVRSVVAHELGHARNHDVVLGTGLGAVGAVLGTCLLALLLDSQLLRRRAGVVGAGDPAVAALVLALVAAGSLLVAPVQNAVSRSIEARADRVALEFTRDPRAFEAMQRQLALHSLADPTPPELVHLWFGTHPTVLQRLGMAQAYARQHPTAAPPAAPGGAGGGGAARWS